MQVVLNKKIFIFIVAIALAVSALVIGLVLGLQGYTSHRLTGAVVSNGYGCATIGGQMLDNGGSAVDAAIATLLCEGVILPQSMGIGGGFVATIYQKSTGKIETLIARESAPAAATQDMFVGQKLVTGAVSGGVPGELLGYYEMHKRYGRLPWSVLFEPSIKLCKEGHIVSYYLAYSIKSKETEIRAEPTLGEIFVKEDGTLYQEGDFMKRPQLGKTLEIIAEKGVDEFYGGGELGKQFVEDIQELGGIITEQDLKDYRVRWSDKNHVSASVTGGYTLYTTPLPTSGVVLAFILNVMNDFNTNNTNVYWHRVVETFKHAYGHRTNLGDLLREQEMEKHILETFNKLKSKDFAALKRALIQDDKTFEDIKHYGANFTNEEDHGTANMAVLAANGDAITVTSTINNYFGGKVRSKRTGIILNDEMDDFSTPGLINGFGVPASPANYIKPGKIPMSSMCPSIILDKDGNVRMLVGAAGGTKITTSVAATIIRYLILNETMGQAIDYPRIHHQLAPMQVDVEQTVTESLQNYLKSVGHTLNIVPEGGGFAAVTGIGAKNSDPEPYYDRRRVGSTMLVAIKNKKSH